MMEAEYEHECSRADLLGLPKPTWDEFISKNQILTKTDHEEEEITTEDAEKIDSRREGFNRIGGGLDELNSILLSTQRKLNSFKTVCGSFGRIFKLHTGTKKADEKGDDSNLTEEENLGGNVSGSEPSKDEANTVELPQPQTKKDSELDKLDSLISKAERAELSLSSQNKQMKKFLN